MGDGLGLDAWCDEPVYKATCLRRARRVPLRQAHAPVRLPRARLAGLEGTATKIRKVLAALEA